MGDRRKPVKLMGCYRPRDRWTTNVAYANC